MSNAVIIPFSVELIKRALDLPPDAIVTGMQFDSFDQTLRIRLDHPDYPEVEEGATPIEMDHPGTDVPVVTGPAGARRRRVTTGGENILTKYEEDYE